MAKQTTWTNTERTVPHFDGSIAELERDLHHRIRGEVRFDSASQAIYSTDASNYRQVPIGVVVPVDIDDLIEAVSVCRDHGAPIVHRGGGTSIAGQCVNAAVVVDGSKYLTRIVDVDTEARTAVVEPGVLLDQLRGVTEPHNLTYGPDPSTHRYCTFGGMIGNNACGIHSQMAGRTEDNVEELDVLTYDGCRMQVGPTSEEEIEERIRHGGREGEIYRQLRDLRDRYAGLIRERYPDIPRRVSGYNLPELLPENGFNLARALVGTEGTCATILRAKVRLVYWPPERVLVVMGYPDVYRAGDHVAEIGELGAMGLEGMDDMLVQFLEARDLHTEHLHLLPEGGGFLIAEFGGDSLEEARGKARRCIDVLRRRHGDRAPTMRLIEDREDQEHIYQIRESGLAATAHQKGESWPGWEDSAVPPEQVGAYLRDLHGLYEKYDYQAAVYGHFGQGCIHTRINFDLQTQGGINTFRAFMDEAADLCVQYGGSLSAEHGDGQSRAELLPKMYGPELVEAFREFKQIWDPAWKMNPGKVVDPYRIDENLRLGTTYNPPEPETYFQFPEDDGSFATAALRCVGVGLCRRREMEGGGEVMCPSYLATNEEMHTTRGRARLLFEMLNGEETPGAWRNDDVFEALDLCLACKGCKNDCPVKVDMATYKAEFLAHYYEGRLRPRYAYAMGLIYWWSRLASKMPRLANFFTQAAGVSSVVKRLAGIAPERHMPTFAEEPFKDWFFRRETRGDDRPRVILWPDTFNNYFQPETLKAAVEVLEGAGFEVDVPRPSLCCGRPLYDFGWLELARGHFEEILDALRDDIRTGIPMVGLEPSCVSAFRDELLNMFPHDEDARRLSRQTFTLAEFLVEQAEDYEPPEMDRKVLVHIHCHHSSVMGFDAERVLLERMGLDVEIVPSSCCGVAGAFGYEAEHFDISMKCGEYRLLPDVRDASPDTLIMTDGFSCQSQIVQATDRRALHLAEVLHMAMNDIEEGGAYPERAYAESTVATSNGRLSATETMVAAGGVLAGAGLTWYLGRR